MSESCSVPGIVMELNGRISRYSSSDFSRIPDSRMTFVNSSVNNGTPPVLATM